MDRLEREWGDKLQVIRLSISSQAGRSAALRYGVRAVPTFIILDSEGSAVVQHTGLTSGTQLRQTLESLVAEAGE